MHKQLRSIKANGLTKKVILLLVMAIIGAGGVYFLSYSHAASPIIAIEPEKGSITAPAMTVADSAASGGSAVKFTRSSSPMPSGMSGSWTMKFDDEFSNSSLDTSKWNVGWLASGITPPVQSQERECYDPAQVTQSSGILHLTMIAKQETCGGTTRPYASGLVNTNGKYSYTYGAAEARMYLPADSANTVANWPAFWDDGQSWPADCENDIMEGLGGGAAYHYMTSNGTWYGGYAPNPNSYSGWHTFASDWEPGSISYYYDGVKLATINQSCSAPHYLIVNNATDSGRNFAPADVQVDYVRVWHH